MNISVPLENGRELFADVRNGELMGLKEPTITDINEHPDKCLYFIQQIFEAIKTQKEIEEMKKEGDGETKE